VSEVRVDPLSGLKTIVAAGRAERPGGWPIAGGDAAPIDPEADPFAPGHEDRTPPEVFADRPGAEIAARAVVFAAFHPRREIWVGFSTLRAILAGHIAGGLADRALARTGYSRQLDKKAVDPDAPHNLFDTVPGAYAVAGRFEEGSRKTGVALFTSRHGAGLLAAVASMAAAGALRARQRRS